MLEWGVYIMADDIKINCNTSQYEVGLSCINNISTSMNDYKDAISSAFKDLENVAEKNKIDLSDTVDLSSIDGDFILYDEYIDDMSSKAKEIISLLEKYSDDPASFISEYNLFLSKNESSNFALRIGDTALMGAAKFSEGFLEFFEDIGDGAIVLSSGVISLLGNKDLAQSWRNFAGEDLSVNLIENNKYFEEISKNSFFDKDSIYADVFKFGGKVAAGIATGKVVSSAFKGISIVKNVEASEDSVEKVSKYSNKVLTAANSFGSNIRDNLNKGYGLKDATTHSLAGVVIDTAIDKGASKFGSDIGSYISSNDKVVTIAKNVDNLATQLFKDDRDTVKQASEKMVDFSANEVEKKTELDDQTSNKEKNSAINAFKSTSKGVVKSVVEDTI